MILLDTNALMWVAEKNPRLGPAASRIVGRALRDDRLAVSAVSFWEVALLSTKDRLELREPPEALRGRTLAQGIREVPLDGVQAINAVRLTGLPADPADRFIVATAIALDATLLTADDRLLRWRGGLKTHDARR